MLSTILGLLTSLFGAIPALLKLFKKSQPTTDEQAIQTQVTNEANAAKDPGSRPQW